VSPIDLVYVLENNMFNYVISYKNSIIIIIQLTIYHINCITHFVNPLIQLYSHHLSYTKFYIDNISSYKSNYQNNSYQYRLSNINYQKYDSIKHNSYIISIPFSFYYPNFSSFQTVLPHLSFYPNFSDFKLLYPIYSLFLISYIIPMLCILPMLCIVPMLWITIIPMLWIIPIFNHYHHFNFSKNFSSFQTVY